MLYFPLDHNGENYIMYLQGMLRKCNFLTVQLHIQQVQNFVTKEIGKNKYWGKN